MIETLRARLRLAISSATPLLSLFFMTFLTAMPISLPTSLQFYPRLDDNGFGVLEHK